jgi:hypothetical protein
MWWNLIMVSFKRLQGMIWAVIASCCDAWEMSRESGNNTQKITAS